MVSTARPRDSASPMRPPEPPVISIVPPNPIAADDLAIQVDEEPSDPDGDLLTWSIQWAVDGEAQPELSDGVPSDLTEKGQVWEVQATVSDGVFTSETALAVVVIGNTPPEASVVVAPAEPTTDDLLRATPAGSDVDGDTIGFQIAWLVNGENSGITGPDVPSSQTAAGQTWSVVVTAVDPEGPGEPSTATVRIQNSVPVVSTLDILPHHPRTGDTLTAEFVGQDPDTADVLEPQYTWTVNGVVVGTDSELPPSAFIRGHEVGLSIALNDGTVVGPARVADPVTIENTPPELLDVLLVPTSPDPTDTVTCNAVGWSDADGDTESYEYAWYVNGIAGPATDTLVLSSVSAEPGDILMCSVTPNDGFDAGTTLFVSTTVVDP